MRTRKVDLVGATAPTFDYIATLGPVARATVSHQMWKHLLEVQARTAAVRTAAVRELRETMTLREVAALLDLSVTRIRQIEGEGGC